MLGGCPIDRNFVYCMVRYQPELLLLIGLVVVGIILVIKHRGGGLPS